MERLDRTLPTELVRQILLYTAPSTLAQVARASQTICELARPLLYREVKIHSGYYIPRSFYLLVRAITENPSLGLHVQSLELVLRHAHHDLEGYRPRQAINPGMFLDFKRILECIYSIDASQSLDFWQTGLSTMDPTALATLLLFHIPNVRRLQLQEYYISQCIFLDALRRQNTLPLARLESIDVLHEEETTFYPPEEEEESPLSYVMHLPSLRHAGGVITRAFAISLPESSSPFAMTSLDCRALQEVELVHFLAFFPSLSTLSYIPCVGMAEKALYHDELYKALVHVRSTLRNLTIMFGARVVIESTGSFGSLASFRKLENLNIPWSLLASIHPPETSPILLPNLRQITINNSISQPYFGGQNSPGYGLVEWLLRCWQIEAPRLERVLVEDGSWSWKEKVDLEILAEETGIELVWVFLDFKGAVSRRG